MSLDGCIAGPDDRFDWTTTALAIGFAALCARYHTALMGRRTWETTRVPFRSPREAGPARRDRP